MEKVEKKTEKEAERGKVDDSRQAPVVIARCLSNSKLLHSLSLNCFCLRMQKKKGLKKQKAAFRRGWCDEGGGEVQPKRAQCEILVNFA